MKNNNQRYVDRFSKVFIVSHWLFAVSFFMLYATGLPLYTEFFDFMYDVFGGPANTRIAHRIFSIIFLIPVFILIIGNRKEMMFWLRNAFSLFKFQKHDMKFFAQFPKDLVGLKADLPKQDFINAGEKMNSVLQVFAFFLLVISGFFMWFPQSFPLWLVQWMYPLHGLAFGLAFGVVIAHIYLSTMHPGSKESFLAITKGYVKEEFARDHHGRWYDDLKKEGKI